MKGGPDSTPPGFPNIQLSYVFISLCCLTSSIFFNPLLCCSRQAHYSLVKSREHIKMSSSTLSATQDISAASPTNAGSPTATSLSDKATTSPISSGAVAGIAIGSAIVGALVAFLIIYIFMKRSKQSRGGRRRHSRDIDLEKSSSPRPGLSLEENLLERADDSQIRKLMQDLNELIDQHVENYYHLQLLENSQGSLERRLVEFGYGADPSIQEMISILKNSKTRFAGIRQLIAMIIVRNIDFKARAEVSLLPPHIARICQSVPPIERQSGCEEGLLDLKSRL